jgi:serine/threonine protein kinase/Tol biopolymer transport system component
MIRCICRNPSVTEVCFVPEVGRSSNVARFQNFELDVRAGELRSFDGVLVRLPEQSRRILLLLLEHPSEVVQREEIRKKLWPNDTIVEFEHSISAAINRLRQALGDSAENPHFIETLARRGYRWMVPVQWSEASTAEQPSLAVPPPNSESFASTLIGRKVSHYRVLQILDGGGMGVVYLAEDLKLGRRVALKFLPEELAHDPVAMQRFEREARAASALNHPNICTIYEVEEHEGQPFIVMELLEGRTLREMIPAKENPPAKSLPIPLPLLLDISIQISAGLEAAHSKGIVHRDIKPANIFVTAASHVKILDFGVAQLQEAETSEQEPRATDAPQSKKVWTPYLTLTRTGTPIGTAGYMSPEQIRGEKLDARTDLFNLGLILYEMAAGRRAFSGETAPALQSAILNSVPAPVRQLHPEIPSKLEGIINKALEKNRELRYQFAHEIRADLEAWRRKFKPIGPSPWKRVTASFVAALLMACAIVWIARHPAMPRQPIRLLKQKQLTVNSSENPVQSGAISADGAYLAFADLRGIHVTEIQSGKMQDLQTPEVLKGLHVDWKIVPGWVPSGAGVIADSQTAEKGLSVWVFPITGQAPRKLSDGGEAWSISRDGEWVAYGIDSLSRIATEHDLWVMRTNGEQARKILEGDRLSGFSGAEWSPDGKQVAAVMGRLLDEQTGKTEWRIVNVDLNGEHRSDLMPVPLDWSWAPDGRIIYSQIDPGRAAGNCNFWSRQFDTATGKLIGEPRRLTDWAGFCMDALSISGDGRHLGFRRWSRESSVEIADFDQKGTKLNAPKRLSLEEGRNYPSAWTPDSRAVIFESFRDGHSGVFRQALGKDVAEPVALEPDHNIVDAQVSPDGTWVLYTIEEGIDILKPRELKRVPLLGGTSELLYSGHIYGGVRCARLPANRCVVAEFRLDTLQIIFTDLDVLKGRGKELAHFDAAPADYELFVWDLSPDGTRISLLRLSDGRIRILPLGGTAAQEIHVEGWTNLKSLSWTADGRGFLAVSQTQTELVLLHVDFSGRAGVLLKRNGSAGGDAFLVGGWLHEHDPTPWVVASPDGQHLAIYNLNLNANMWLMENF